MGCDGGKLPYIQAGQIHGKNIAMVAALRPLLAPLPDWKPPGDAGAGEAGQAAWRFVARAARAEIVRHALDSADYRRYGKSGKQLGPVERLGGAFANLVPRCTLSDPRNSRAEQFKTAACEQAVRDLGKDIDAVADLAERAGLPRGTVPRLDQVPLTAQARRLRDELDDLLLPVASEQARRRLWLDAHAGADDLRAACEAMRDEARTRPPGVYQELAPPCNLLGEVLGNLALVADCHEASCLKPGLCQAIGGYVQRADELPAGLIPNLQAATAMCQPVTAQPAR